MSTHGETLKPLRLCKKGRFKLLNLFFLETVSKSFCFHCKRGGKTALHELARADSVRGGKKQKKEKVYGTIKEFGEASQMSARPVKCLKLEQRIKERRAQP